MKKKIMFMGRSGAGKTTLTQALYGEDIEYHKTQYVNYSEYIIDPPGEYIEDKQFGFALALYSYEVDVVGFILAANEPFSLYSPASTATATRPVIGIVTQINNPGADPALAKEWLEIAGCEKVFFIDSVTREGLGKLIDYLGWNEDEKTDGKTDEKPDGKPDGNDGKTDEKPTKEKAGKKQKASSVIKKSENKGKKQRSAKA